MRFLTSLLEIFTTALACTPATAALPSLNCTLHYGGRMMPAEFKAGGPAYETRGVEAGDFRVKAVIIEQGSQTALVKIYTYYKLDTQYSLLHMARQIVPLQAGTQQIPLSGMTNFIYAPGLGHELSYECLLSLSD